MNITKQGIISHNYFIESTEYMTLSDGSKWLKMYDYDYDVANSFWTEEEDKFANSPGKFSILGSLNNIPTVNGWYEFYYTH